MKHLDLVKLNYLRKIKGIYYVKNKFELGNYEKRMWEPKIKNNCKVRMLFSFRNWSLNQKNVFFSNNVDFTLNTFKEDSNKTR